MAEIYLVPEPHREHARRIHPATTGLMSQPELDGRAAELAGLTEKAARLQGEPFRHAQRFITLLTKSCAPAVLGERLAELDRRYEVVKDARGVSEATRQQMSDNRTARRKLIARNPQSPPAEPPAAKAPLPGPSPDMIYKAYVAGQAREASEKLIALSQVARRSADEIARRADAERLAAEYNRLAETVAGKELRRYYADKALEVLGEGVKP